MANSELKYMKYLYNIFKKILKNFTYMVEFLKTGKKIKIIS